jgi:hypothetical protein
MSSNKLKLNKEKTEVLIVGSKLKTRTLNITSIKICDQELQIKDQVKSLGVIIDSNLTMSQHVSQLRKVCYLELRRIAHIRSFLTPEAANKLACAFVISRLDYCNSLLTGIPSYLLNKLQQIQNNAARLISKTSKREHITPVLESLHWLPLKSRLEYKIASFVYQCRNDPLFPAYLTDLLQIYNRTRHLRSSQNNFLTKPKINLKSIGERSFVFQSPETWNKLHKEIKEANSVNSFKNKLKTSLFREVYK